MMVRRFRWLARLLWAVLTTARRPRRYTKQERELLDVFEEWRGR